MAFVCLSLVLRNGSIKSVLLSDTISTNDYLIFPHSELIATRLVKNFSFFSSSLTSLSLSLFLSLCCVGCHCWDGLLASSLSLSLSFLGNKSFTYQTKGERGLNTESPSQNEGSAVISPPRGRPRDHGRG